MSTTAATANHDFAIDNAQRRVFAPIAAMPGLFTDAEFQLYTALIFECRNLEQLAISEEAMRAVVAERMKGHEAACEKQRRSLAVVGRGGIDAF